ncbi:ATP-binding protein [Enterovibrio norvegicus]|uniref:ATP-binding protein n=1 Tax=Enterovibrio norvegicus TaxID=188144 RepID=UPI003D160E15
MGRILGKTTLCNDLSIKFGLNHYSSSSLIKQYSDYEETSKKVSSPEKNQTALLKAIRDIKEDTILLDGHFVLIGKDLNPVPIDFEIFDAISPLAIINITCDEGVIYERINNRDPNSTAKCDTLQYQAANTISLKTIAGCLKPKHFFGR